MKTVVFSMPLILAVVGHARSTDRGKCQFHSKAKGPASLKALEYLSVFAIHSASDRAAVQRWESDDPKQPRSLPIRRLDQEPTELAGRPTRGRAPKKFRMSSSKSAPASTWASSKNGTGPQASISRAICFATHVSALLWLMKTSLLFLIASSCTYITILRLCARRITCVGLRSGDFPPPVGPESLKSQGRQAVSHFASVRHRVDNVVHADPNPQRGVFLGYLGLSACSQESPRSMSWQMATISRPLSS